MKAITKPYLSDQSMMEEILETHQVWPVIPAGGKFPTAWRVMVLQNYNGRQKWYRLQEFSRQTTAVAFFRRLVARTMHNRIAALGWDDSD